MIRKEDQEISKKIFLVLAHGIRKRGRPRPRWRDVVGEIFGVTSGTRSGCLESVP